MRAMVLAAGKGTRLKPFTDTLPKPMMPVAGRPLLEYIIAQLKSAGITDLWINLHHEPDAVRNHFGDGARFGVRIRYSHETHLLGTAGAVKKLAAHFTETFLVYYGDNYVEIDLADMIRIHNASRADATLALFPTDTPHMSGIADMDDKLLIRRFVEKPAPADGLGNLANAGVYVIEPGVLKDIPADRASDFGRDIFPALIQRGRSLRAYPLRGKVIGIDTPELHARLETYLAGGPPRP